MQILYGPDGQLLKPESRRGRGKGRSSKAAQAAAATTGNGGATTDANGTVSEVLPFFRADLRASAGKSIRVFRYYVKLLLPASWFVICDVAVESVVPGIECSISSESSVGVASCKLLLLCFYSLRPCF